MKKLKKSEKRLIVILAALLLLAGVSYSLAPKQELTVEDIQAFYIDIFAGAQEIVVRPAQGDGASVTVTGADAIRIGSQMDALCRYAGFSQTPAPAPAPWIVDVKTADGPWRKNIAVGLTLDSPDQPFHGRIWIVPKSPGDTLSPDPEATVEEIPPAIRIFDKVMGVDRSSQASAAPTQGAESAPATSETP